MIVAWKRDRDQPYCPLYDIAACMKLLRRSRWRSTCGITTENGALIARVRPDPNDRGVTLGDQVVDVERKKADEIWGVQRGAAPLTGI